MKKIIKKSLCFLIPAFIIVSCNNYGTFLEFNGGELYYTSKITEREAYKLGEYLVDSEFFDGERKTVQIDRIGDTYEFRMVIKKGLEQDEEFIEIMKYSSKLLSQDVFNGYSVDMHLCDEYLNTIRVVVSLN